MKSSARELKLPLWSRPGYLIRRLHQIHVALFLEELRDSGLTPVQYGLLTALSFRGELDQKDFLNASDDSCAFELAIPRDESAGNQEALGGGSPPIPNPPPP